MRGRRSSWMSWPVCVGVVQDGVMEEDALLMLEVVLLVRSLVSVGAYDTLLVARLMVADLLELVRRPAPLSPAPLPRAPVFPATPLAWMLSPVYPLAWHAAGARGWGASTGHWCRVRLLTPPAHVFV
jgi:hypothetical protein